MRPSTSVQCLRRAVCAERAELLLNNRIGQGIVEVQSSVCGRTHAVGRHLRTWKV